MAKKQNSFSLKFDTDWQYSEAPESTSHIQIKKKYELFIDGEFVKPQSKKYFDSINPATEEPISKVAEANEKDVDAAVQAARRAFPKWSGLDPKDRAKYIYRIARLIQERAREFAVIESMDGGKPIKESSIIEFSLAVTHFYYYTG